MGDIYSIIKGKALTMVREFQKVYPKADGSDIHLRVFNEVWFAADHSIPNTREIDTSRLHKIIAEIKEEVRKNEHQ